MRRSLILGLLSLFAVVGCGPTTPTGPLSKDAEAQQAAQQKDVDNAENAFQKQSGGIQDKPKKPAK